MSCPKGMLQDRRLGVAVCCRKQQKIALASIVPNDGQEAPVQPLTWNGPAVTSYTCRSPDPAPGTLHGQPVQSALRAPKLCGLGGTEPLGGTRRENPDLLEVCLWSLQTPPEQPHAAASHFFRFKPLH
ncbi:unnamed protein product [Natator depressus]